MNNNLIYYQNHRKNKDKEAANYYKSLIQKYYASRKHKIQSSLDEMRKKGEDQI